MNRTSTNKLYKNRIYITLNKANLLYNIKNIKKLTKDKLICAVIKDNAYNHGELDILKTISKYVNFYASSTLDEALSIRNNDKKTMILILSHIDKSGYKIAIKNNIALTCSTYKQINDINNEAKKLKKMAYIHIAINTGMNRIGFPITENTIKELKKANKLSNVKLEGIYSHFACCDSYNDDKFSKNFTNKQKEWFDEVVAKLHFEGIDFKYIHIANSAGIIYKKFDNTNMVRPGIILYGLKPDINCKNIIKLKQVMSLKTFISFIKTIDKNEYISYGATFKTKKRMKIATIQVGYGDGYPRILSGIQDVYINNHRCKIIGRITMDQTMIDVSNIKCKVGDEVELFGPHISIYELANNSNTIPYEIFCGLNKRIERKIT